MRWFKHYSDAHRSVQMQTAFRRLGYKAYSIYIIMELCNEQINRGDNRVENKNFTFVFERVHLQSVLRMKRVGYEFILRSFAELRWFNLELNDNEVIIEFPNLLDLLDRDYKKPRQVRVRDAQKPRLDLDLDLDLDKDEEKNIKKEASPLPVSPDTENSLSPKKLIEFWNNNCVPLPKATKLSDSRRKKCETQIRKYPEIEHWTNALNKFKESTFACEVWVPGFDVFLDETKRLRAIEGQYADKGTTESPFAKSFDKGF
jgi:hypothetical protein